MPVQPLGLRAGDRGVLQSWVRSSAIRSGLAQRARIVLLAADGMSNTAIAEQVGVSRPTVISWRQRYTAGGLAGLDDRPKSGRPRTVDRAKILAETLTPPPAKLGVSHWSSRLLAEHLRTNQSTVLRTWRHYRVQPWRVQTFKFSTDPELIAKVTGPRFAGGAPSRWVVPGTAGERDSAVCGREVANPSPGPDAEDAADADRVARAPQPRLRPARHLDLVRRVGHRHRQGDGGDQTAAPPPGVPGLPQTGRPGLPRPAAASS